MRIFLLIALVVGEGFAASPGKSTAQLRLDERMPVWLKAFHVTGVGIAYIEGGKPAWTAFYGDQVPGGPKAGERTLYSVASLTKPITAEIILRLAAAGALSLDETISAFWTDPDVKDNPWSKLLTPRLCLSHQTGFTNWRYQTGNVLQFQWQPGANFGYSGEGFDYVARFAERRTGETFEQLAEKKVFEPIGMHDTSFTPREWWRNRQAKPTENGDRTKWSAADLLRTTVGDYTNFVVSVMHNHGVTPELAAERLKITRNLTTEEEGSVLCEAATDPQGCRVETGFGLGWHIVRINGETIPRRRIGAVIFTDGPDVGHSMIDKVLGVVYHDAVYAGTLWPR